VKGRGCAIIIALLFLALASLPAAGRQSVTVTLTAEPQECALKIQGAGEYPIGGEVTIEVKVKPECRFVKWEIIRGLKIKEVAVNPFTFYPEEDFEAKAILEPLYRRPEGIVERVIIRVQANASGLTLPEPMIVIKGTPAVIPLPSKQLVGEYEYAFLYAEDSDGNRYYDPEIRLIANRSLTVVGYYAAFKQFLNEYYPLSSFLKPEIPPILESEGVRLYPVGFAIANKTFPLGTEVPVQLLPLIEPIYERQVKIRIEVVGPSRPIELVLLGEPIRVINAWEEWVKAGSQISIKAPRSYEAYELVEVEPYAALEGGGVITVNASQPTLLRLHYRASEIAFLLEVPVLGPPLFQLTKSVEGMTGVRGIPALALVVCAFIIAPSGIGCAAVITARRAAARKLIKATAAERGLELVMESVSSPKQPFKAKTGDALSARGPLKLPEDLKGVIESLLIQPQANLNRDSMEHEVALDEGVMRDDAEEELEKALMGRVKELAAEVLLHAQLDERKFNLLNAALSRGLRIVGDLGYFGYEAQATALIKMLVDPSIPFFAVVCEDEGLARKVLDRAGREAGVRIFYLETLTETSPKMIAGALKAATKRGEADIIVLSGLSRFMEEAVVRSTPLLEVKVALITRTPWIKPNVTLSINEGYYARLAAALLAVNGLTGYVSWRHLLRLGQLANGCGGISTIERFLEILEEVEDGEEALSRLTIEELGRTFKPEELKLLLSATSMEELREAYMSLIRQLRPGSDPIQEWANFYLRLKKMGVVGA